MSAARHAFVCPGLGDDTAFRVRRFDGEEAISQPFRYEIHLDSVDPNVNFNKILDQPATLTMRRGDDDSLVPGIVSEIQLTHATGGSANRRYVYRAVLVPQLWRLGLSTQSRIFQGMTVQAIVEKILGVAKVPVEFKLKATYAARDYTTQYEESDLDFVQRLLEFEGIRYHFETKDKAEVVVFTDDMKDAPPITADDFTVPFSQGDGMVVAQSPAASAAGADLDNGRGGGSGRGGDQDPAVPAPVPPAPPAGPGAPRALEPEVVRSLHVSQRIVQASVTEKDYNYETDTTALLDEKPVADPPGTAADPVTRRLGVLSEAMTHTKTVDRTKHLATVRAQEIESTREVMTGSGDCLRFRSGHTYTQTGHFRADLNQSFLLTQITHTGGNPDIGKVVDTDVAGRDTWTSYANTFRCVRVTVTYRPPRRTPVPKLPGVLTAKVEASSGTYAPIDDQGRYRVRFPFDLGAAGKGLATKPVRLAQPYSGAGYGQHFPLYDGAEMVVACVNGDPDRIIGLGSVPNSTKTSPVVSANNSHNVVKTAAANQILLKDTVGTIGVDISSPTAASRLHLGAADGAVEGVQIETDGTTMVHGGGGVWVKAGGSDPESMMGMDIGTFGTACTAVDAAIGLVAAAMGTRLHNAEFRAAVNTVAAAVSTGAGVLNTAVGTTMGILFPGIFMTSPGGILMATTAGVSIYGGIGGIGLTSVTGIDLTAATLGINLLVGAGGINIGAGQGGIATTAVLNDIDTWAKSGKVTTKAATGIESTTVAGGIESTAAAGNIKTEATTGNIQTDAMVGSVDIAAGTELNLLATTKLTLECGLSKLEMLPNGTITLTAGTQKIELGPPGVYIESATSVGIEGTLDVMVESKAKLDLKAALMASLAGNLVDLKATAAATVGGALIKVG